MSLQNESTEFFVPPVQSSSHPQQQQQQQQPPQQHQQQQQQYYNHPNSSQYFQSSSRQNSNQQQNLPQASTNTSPMSSANHSTSASSTSSLAATMIAQYPSIPQSAFSLDSPPPGIKPRVTTTLWEDEGTLCFQVEARNVCVARREDNNMINGTKLLNVAGMTRGRRDGILKTEKVRRVIKVGAMHFKGVWIPYERALVLAGKENIVDILYPLFVADIKSLLYHPNNYARTALVMAAAERKREEQQKQQLLQQQNDQQQNHHQQQYLIQQSTQFSSPHLQPPQQQQPQMFNPYMYQGDSSQSQYVLTSDPRGASSGIKSPLLHHQSPGGIPYQQQPPHPPPQFIYPSQQMHQQVVPSGSGIPSDVNKHNSSQSSFSLPVYTMYVQPNQQQQQPPPLQQQPSLSASQQTPSHALPSSTQQPHPPPLPPSSGQPSGPSMYPSMSA